MLIVLPVTKADSGLAVDLAAHIHAMGHVSKHDVLILSNPSTPTGDVATIHRYFATSFNRTFQHCMRENDERGWFQSSNTMFKEASRWVRMAPKDVGDRGWYFFEADNTPMTPEWADRLEIEYLWHRKPYMGVVVTSVFINSKGETSSNGRHMTGTGIYPKFLDKCTLWLEKVADDLPWDVYGQWFIVPRCHDTKLIQHNFRTSNYRVVKQRGKPPAILCEPAPGAEKVTNNRNYAAPVRPDAVVVHGCKDGSLMRIVQKTMKPNPELAYAV